MIVNNTGKRKRLVQTTLHGILKRQRVLKRIGETSSSNMADVIEVNSSGDNGSAGTKIDTSHGEGMSTKTKNESENVEEISLEETTEINDNDEDKSLTNVQTKNESIESNSTDKLNKTDQIEEYSSEASTEIVNEDNISNVKIEKTDVDIGKDDSFKAKVVASLEEEKNKLLMKNEETKKKDENTDASVEDHVETHKEDEDKLIEEDSGETLKEKEDEDTPMVEDNMGTLKEKAGEDKPINEDNVETLKEKEGEDKPIKEDNMEISKEKEGEDKLIKEDNVETSKEKEGEDKPIKEDNVEISKEKEDENKLKEENNVEILKHNKEEEKDALFEGSLEGRIIKKEVTPNINEENGSVRDTIAENSFEDQKEVSETTVERTDKVELSDGAVGVQGNDDDKSLIEEDMESKKENDDDTQDYEWSVPESQSSIDEDPVRLGVEYDTLLRAPDCCGPTKTLSPGPTHAILFRLYKPSQPYPSKYRDKWDRYHVRMPCSKESLYPATDGKKKLLSRWELIRRSLKTPMASSYDLQDAILSYNAHHAKRWNFRLLHIFLLEKISPEENKEFFAFILPGIIQMALLLPEVCTQPLPLLKRQEEHTITMTQQQAASLLANAFLCTFPRRNTVARNSEHEFGNYPDINFNRLFQLGDHLQSHKKVEKLKCILHYFKRILQQPLDGTISYKRQVLKQDETPKWHSSSTKLCRLRVCSDGTIEDNAPGLLQVDFANKFVGGGVLGEGCVQEEIRFAICPELIVSRLFTERLEDNECLIVTGAERFSDYVGYARTFQWAGNHDDKTPRDSWGRLHTEIVAIDAKPRMQYSEQFSPGNLKRELEKAYCGFFSRNSIPKHLPAVATGNWGCGAFNGDPQLKSLIQIMAASAAQRDVLYFTFNEKEHARELYAIHSILKNGDIAIGDLWQILNQYRKQISSEGPTPRDLFEFIREVLGTSDEQHNVTELTADASSEESSPLLFEDSQDTRL